MNLFRYWILFIPLLASRLVVGQTSWPSDLITVTEKTEFLKTSTHNDVIRFLDHLQSRSKEIQVFSMGQSLEGKEIPVACYPDQPLIRLRRPKLPKSL